jgi:glycerophosphoryl diester phosphodiesterase
LAALTAAELERLDAGCRFEERGSFPFRNQGVGIPTLHDVLRRYPDARIIIEMKVDSREMGESVARAVRATAAVERVCAAGYGLHSMRAARAALPEMASSACHAEVRQTFYRTLAGWPVRHAPYGGYQVPEYAGPLRIVSARFVRYARESGLKVHVWTVDGEADMRRFLAMGVDGLISNRPDLAVRIRNQPTGPTP